MNRLLVGALALTLGVSVAQAQRDLQKHLDDLNIQIHGYATQSLLFSNDNNYLGMNTSAGNIGWTEAAVNINDRISRQLRAGVQLHYTRLGAFGGDKPSVDWALGDFKARPWLGVRAGKVKIRWGLYNDTQDYDPGYMWALLPESIYGIDLRTTNLSQWGAEVYGKVSIAKKMGRLDYSGYYGYYYYASNDGYMAIFAASGIKFKHPPSGITPGFDLRWTTPVPGLKVGGSLMTYNASGTLTNGSYTQPLAYWPTFYAQYETHKVDVSAQYMKLVQYQTFAIQGNDPATSGADSRAWFAMCGYHVTGKLQAGAYYNRYLLASGGDSSNPANYFREWVASSRYEIDSNFYAKLEGHFVSGNGVGFYGFDNVNGFKPKTNFMVAKIGFTF